MKVYALIFLVLITVVAFVCANPATNGDDCNINGVYIKKGEYSYVVGECQKTYCHGKNAISGISCGMVGVLPGSKCKYMPLDPSKPFPECCPHFYDC